ncbi:hypothetical protein DFH08DRAFT_817030 [Mycena albidolilacea]|uniref:Protein kinase domain-containing protein n=1 Tax=Mycena albidolilacea TaxID=1033008 RepID=A0AAD6ZKL3_9AGAR|nr:hypothetical protein DFH08DRAFT_817030 [Mycena albidolilacea]
MPPPSFISFTSSPPMLPSYIHLTPVTLIVPKHELEMVHKCGCNVVVPRKDKDTHLTAWAYKPHCLPSSMTEIVGLVASVLQLVDTVAKARNYVQGSRNARKDQKTKLLLEIQNLQPLIVELHQRLTGNQVAGPAPSRGVAQRLSGNGYLVGVATHYPTPIANHYQGLHSRSGRHRASSAVKDVREKADRTVHSVVAVGRDQQKYHHDIISTMTHTAEEQRTSHNEPDLTRSLQLFGVKMEVGRDQRQYHQDEFTRHVDNKSLSLPVDVISTVAHATEEQRIGHKAVECDTKIAWYSPLNLFLRQADVFSGHQSGTGAWFLQHKVFQEWKWMSEKYYGALGCFLTASLRTAPQIVDGALGVEFLHRGNVVHGDLKSANILVTLSGRAYVADFGLCCKGGFLTTRPQSSRAQPPKNHATAVWGTAHHELHRDVEPRQRLPILEVDESLIHPFRLPGPFEPPIYFDPGRIGDLADSVFHCGGQYYLYERLEADFYTRLDWTKVQLK